MTAYFSDAANSKLKAFFVYQLRDIYWAELKLATTLPKLRKAASNSDLRDAFEKHLFQTENHLQR